MPKQERFKIIPEVFLIIVKDGEILLSRRFQTGYEDGNYGLPAGHLEEGETVREGTVREAYEEIGITLKPENLRHIVTMHRYCDDPENPHSRVGFYFLAEKYEGEIRNAEPDKCDDLRFFPLGLLPSNVIGHIRAAIEAYQKGITYTEFDWEKK
jgi:8-oxo-dGTP diphosphatase